MVKVGAGSDEIGVGVVAVAKLGRFVAIVGVLAAKVELFTAGVKALSLLPKLGFPLVFL